MEGEISIPPAGWGVRVLAFHRHKFPVCALNGQRKYLSALRSEKMDTRALREEVQQEVNAQLQQLREEVMGKLADLEAAQATRIKALAEEEQSRQLATVAMSAMLVLVVVGAGAALDYPAVVSGLIKDFTTASATAAF
jgi:hypothetical protein